MSSKYWIKLYHEMLHDPKMGRMSDHLYRRTIELFLMAGEEAKDGQLPSLDNMAWIFRVDPDELETDLVELQKVGILSSMNGEWYVTNFTKRQEPMDKSEYMQRKREESKRQKYYQPVTNSNTESDIDTDKNQITESESEEPPKPFNELLTTFINKTKLPAFGMKPRDVEALKHMEKAGVLPVDIESAVDEMGDDYTIVGPASVQTASINCMRKRTNGGGKKKIAAHVGADYAKYNNTDD